MKRRLIIGIMLLSVWGFNPGRSQDLVDLVNPRIGSVSNVLTPTVPVVFRPYGMIRFWPVTTLGNPESYLDNRIYGFPLNRPDHTGGPAITVMPFKGKEALLREEKGVECDHDFETVSPYYYSVQLDEMEMKVEFAPTKNCAYFAFSSAQTEDLVLLFETDDISRFQLKGSQIVNAYETYNGVRQHVNIFFNHPVKESGYINEDGKLVRAKSVKGTALKYYLVFDGSVQLMMNYGISWVNSKQAGRNLLKENPGWNLQKTVNAGLAAWNRELGKIEVKGGTRDQRVTFYTALYRSLESTKNGNKNAGFVEWHLKDTLSLQNIPEGLTELMGNESGFHDSYLYTLAGQPWKTQKRVRQLMDTWFRNDLMGICGDEDGGDLSPWYVFSAMGFYPVTPGKAEYVLGSPIFEEIKIDLGNGKFFTIKAPFVSTQNKYIQSVTLNGEIHEGYILSHQAIVDGGTLVLDMGSVKN